jgi:hypothetical protein
MPIVVAVLGVVIVVMGAVLFLTPADQAPTTPESIVEEANRTDEMVAVEETNVETSPNPTPDTTAGTTFTEDVSYLTPARTEHKMAVSLTITDGVVTDSTIVYDGGEGFSNPNQERFDAAYKAEVIGKTLSEISLSRVGGASLTSQAFNDAVAKIAAQQS